MGNAESHLRNFQKTPSLIDILKPNSRLRALKVMYLNAFLLELEGHSFLTFLSPYSTTGIAFYFSNGTLIARISLLHSFHFIVILRSVTYNHTNPIPRLSSGLVPHSSKFRKYEP